MRPIWRQSNDVLDVSGICSPIEGKCDDEDNDADHFKVGGRNEGHEDHAEGRYQKGKCSVHLEKVKGDEATSTTIDNDRPFAYQALETIYRKSPQGNRIKQTFCILSLEIRPLAMRESETAPAATAYKA